MSPAGGNPHVSIEIEGNRAVGLGVALGAGLGGTVGILAGDALVAGVGYGVATGLVVAAILVLVGPSLSRSRRPRLALVTLGGVLGMGVGGLVGIVGAWSVGASIASGLNAGGAGGVALGVLLAGVLALSAGRVEPPRSGGV